MKSNFVLREIQECADNIDILVFENLVSGTFISMKVLLKVKLKLKKQKRNSGIRTRENFECTKVDLESQAAQGLETHTTRYHTIITNEGYPKTCNLCESKFGNASDMRKYMHCHLFKDASFKYEDCEFVGQSEETMEVHIRLYTNIFYVVSVK